MSAAVARLTPIHTDFGSNRSDLLVTEYDVPLPKVKQTLFYKFGLLSIPKWALIPLGIFTFGILAALLAIIVNAIVAQPSSSVTYSQGCSKTSKCRTSLGLTCGSESKCVCQSTKYWYEGSCTDKPTYTETCNQTSECRTDLGLVCSQLDGLCLCPTWTKVRTCDCPRTSYWTGSMCTPRSTYQGACTVADTSYQCLSNLYCNGATCTCAPDLQYWNGTATNCFPIDTYRTACDPATSESCRGSVGLRCLSVGLGAQCPLNATAGSATCECLNGTYWNGGSCVNRKTWNSSCFWNCECNTGVGLQCLNTSCVCPKKLFWSTLTSACETQMNYTGKVCTNTSQCDGTQGLVCYLSGSACNCPNNSTVGMCDCVPGQFYETNTSSCQPSRLYNETCTADFMCDSTVGLFCQTTVNSAKNCSCPEPIRSNMCDCNMSSYWNGVACVARLAANVSCSFGYQCQTNLTCIVNRTDDGIFSDVCRCPLGSYFVSGLGCVPSLTYTQSCVGSYQCNEIAPLICRYNTTAATCLRDTGSLLPSCDCNENYFYDNGTGTCQALRLRNNNCTESCQCTSPYFCIPNRCVCRYYYSSLLSTCVTNLQYGDQCSNTTDCAATPGLSMACVNGTCGCNGSSVWNGSLCSFSINFRASCRNNADCLGGLICRTMGCLTPQNRCACPGNTYYSFTSQTCISCLSAPGFIGYVIRYPTTDLCLGVFNPTTSSTIAFTSANSTCNSLTAQRVGYTPRLLSIHNQSELNCIASVLRGENNLALCDSSGNDHFYYYLGYDTGNRRFYDGTYGCDVWPSNLCVGVTQCVTYCSENNSNGKFKLALCGGVYNGPGDDYFIGALCDYRVNE